MTYPILKVSDQTIPMWEPLRRRNKMESMYHYQKTGFTLLPCDKKEKCTSLYPFKDLGVTCTKYVKSYRL